jgi:hypothetical protein
LVTGLAAAFGFAAGLGLAGALAGDFVTAVAGAFAAALAGAFDAAAAFTSGSGVGAATAFGLAAVLGFAGALGLAVAFAVAGLAVVFFGGVAMRANPLFSLVANALAYQIVSGS